MRALLVGRPGRAAPGAVPDPRLAPDEVPLRAGAFSVAAAVTRVVPLEEAGGALREWDADPGPVTRIHVRPA